MTEHDKINQILLTVMDPEVPVLTISDLGVLRDVIIADDLIEVVITPTYTGCPAMDMIEVNIKAALQENGYESVKVSRVLSPAWTTDWISEEGRQKLLEYGIAPPQRKGLSSINGEVNIPCPQCASTATEMISHFGSTACKALYKCNDCKEPFDYFKCL